MTKRTKIVTVLAAFTIALAVITVIVGGPRLEAYRASQVGGPFTLTAHTGQIVTDRDFRGQYMLIYFGFTFCPDICPATLLSMSNALESLGAEADPIQPIFITIDPERDTADLMASYVSYFHPRLLGLTGTAEQIASVARAYHVYYKKVDSHSSGNYLMDHTSIIYLMGPDGTYLSHYSDRTPPEDLARDLRRFLKSSTF